MASPAEEEGDVSAFPFDLPTEAAFTAEFTHATQSTKADIHRNCQRLMRDAVGVKLALLQTLSLKRSSSYAALYKSTMLSQARHLQRQRADLVKLLQRRTRELLTAPTTEKEKNKSRDRGEGRAFPRLESVWALVKDAYTVERPRAEVGFVLCPSLPALGRFLQVAVVERGLHERVMAAVLAAPSPPPPAPNGVHPPGETQSSSNNISSGGGFGEDVTGGDAALGESMELLFQCIDRAECGGGAAEGSSSPRVRLPILFSLERLIQDAPWCTTHDALNDDERRRRAQEDPDGDHDPSDRIGFLFLKRTRSAGGGGGGGSGAGGVRDRGAPTASTSLRDRPQTAFASSAFASVFDSEGARGSIDPPRRRGEEGREADGEEGGLLADAMHVYAQALATEITEAVDAAWTSEEREAAVEDLILSLLRRTAGRKAARGNAPVAAAGVVDVDAEDESAPSANDDSRSVREVVSEKEESQLATVQEFLDVVRVFYSVELSSRILALNIAAKLLKDSKDFVCVDGLRCVQLCVGARPKPWWTAESSVLGPLLPVTVFNLPDAENVFCAVALTLGLALLRDYQSFVNGGGGEEEEGAGREEEEEALRWEQRGVCAATVRRHRRAVAWLSTFEATWLSARPSAEDHGERGFASALRLWQYLWAYVFRPFPSPAPRGSGDGDDEVEVEVLTPESGSPGSVDMNQQECIPLSYARARRWLEKQVAAALPSGVANAQLIAPSEAEGACGPSAETELSPMLAAAGSRIRRETAQLWPRP